MVGEMFLNEFKGYDTFNPLDPVFILALATHRRLLKNLCESTEYTLRQLPRIIGQTKITTAILVIAHIYLERFQKFNPASVFLTAIQPLVCAPFRL